MSEKMPGLPEDAPESEIKKTSYVRRLARGALYSAIGAFAGRGIVETVNPHSVEIDNKTADVSVTEEREGNKTKIIITPNQIEKAPKIEKEIGEIMTSYVESVKAGSTNEWWQSHTEQTTIDDALNNLKDAYGSRREHFEATEESIYYWSESTNTFYKIDVAKAVKIIDDLKSDQRTEIDFSMKEAIILFETQYSRNMTVDDIMEHAPHFADYFKHLYDDKKKIDETLGVEELKSDIDDALEIVDDESEIPAPLVKQSKTQIL